MPRRCVWFVLLALSAFAGCAQPDDIQTYSVPKPTKEQEPEAEPAVKEWRMLAAIVPIDQKSSYFVRFLTRADVVANLEPDFDQFLFSLRFTGDKVKPLSWTVPKNWQTAPDRFARTVTISPLGHGKTEIYISEPIQGSVIDNVNRWREKFIGIPPIEEKDLSTCTKTLDVNGVKVIRVDIQGPGGPEVLNPTRPKFPG